MAVSKSVVRTGYAARKLQATSDPLRAAATTATQRELDRYDDQALLSQPQARVVTRVKRAVRIKLRREVPELLAEQRGRDFSLSLGEYVLNETRKRQFAAFERWLAEQYGPLEPIDVDDYNSRWSEVNGVRIFRVDPPRDQTIAPSEA